MAGKKKATTKSKKKAPKNRRYIWWGGLACCLLLLIGSAFGVLGLGNVSSISSVTYLNIRKTDDFGAVMRNLQEMDALRSQTTFEWTASLLRYTSNVKPGRYPLRKGMGNLELVLRLRNGIQEPVQLSFTSRRSLQHLAEKICPKLEMSEAEFLAVANDRAFLDSIGVQPSTLIALFIPNTYQVYWDISPHELVRRMKKEYDAFWTPERREKARARNLSPLEVVTMASIVEAETNKVDEKPRIAGVYLNRLREGWMLQADPTVKFALQDFDLKRVYLKHTKVESPYNTYLNAGLPPGPINCPSIASIDAVLNAEQHDYFFFVARSDLSGYHDFSGEDEFLMHWRKARKYRRKLDNLEIR